MTQGIFIGVNKGKDVYLYKRRFSDSKRKECKDKELVKLQRREECGDAREGSVMGEMGRV